MIEIETKIEVIEENGVEWTVGQTYPPLIIKSHPEQDDVVILKVGLNSYAVTANDLLKAVTNATGWA